jgi:hypothetical protein
MRSGLRNFLRTALRAKRPIYDLTRGLESFARALCRLDKAFLVFLVFLVSGQLYGADQ